MWCLTDLIFSLVALESIFENPHSTLLLVTFGRHWSRFAQLPNFYRHVGLKILKYLIAQGMISSKNEGVCIRDFRDLTLKFIFDTWWASMNVGSKRSIAWNNYRQGSPWRIYFHSGIEETGSLGNICIVCHQVPCHPSDHGTSSIGENLLSKAHMAKLNELTESDVTELTSWRVDQTSSVILKKWGCRGITIVSPQRKFIIDIRINPYWSK